MKKDVLRRLLKDKISKIVNIREINTIYLDVYNDYPKPFNILFAYYHSELNRLFDFMNNKIKYNFHFNAEQSRNLIDLIEDIIDLQKALENTEYAIKIVEKYDKYIKYVSTFLSYSGGSSIPTNTPTFQLIKYEPVFSFLLYKHKSLADIPIQSIETFSNYGDFSVLATIHPDIFVKVRSLLESGHNYQAVEEAFKIVREKLRELTGEEQAHKAFSSNNSSKIFPKPAKTKTEEEFREGVKFLHMAIQKFRNEKFHQLSKPLALDRALKYIILASLGYELIVDEEPKDITYKDIDQL